MIDLTKYPDSQALQPEHGIYNAVTPTHTVNDDLKVRAGLADFVLFTGASVEVIREVNTFYHVRVSASTHVRIDQIKFDQHFTAV